MNDYKRKCITEIAISHIEIHDTHFNCVDFHVAHVSTFVFNARFSLSLSVCVSLARMSVCVCVFTSSGPRQLLAILYDHQPLFVPTKPGVVVDYNNQFEMHNVGFSSQLFSHHVSHRHTVDTHTHNVCVPVPECVMCTNGYRMQPKKNWYKQEYGIHVLCTPSHPIKRINGVLLPLMPSINEEKTHCHAITTTTTTYGGIICCVRF